MRCVFVAIGWENIAMQALSAMLKKHGHEVHLVYDQCLFDDKNYLCIRWMAKLFEHKDLVLRRIIELKPDLVAFHVQTVQHLEMRALARELKKRYRVPVIFGGIHPHSAPEDVLLPQDPAVDMICLGEGEYALLELCNSMERGKIDYSIKNLWFRLDDGALIRNEMRSLIGDLDALPIIDKELFAPHVPMHLAYLSSPSRGCPFSCSYCSLSFLGEEARKLKGPRIRERSVESLIAEIKGHIAKYGSKWVDFRHPVMSSSTKWTVEFCKRYKEEIGLPFHCFSHPLLIDEDCVRAFKEAGCFGIQIGIESWNEEIRKTVINRQDSNEDIRKATEILERYGQPYTFDYILGLPRLPKRLPDGTERRLMEDEILTSYEEELFGFAEFIAPLKHCYRIAPFMIQYMPGTELVEHGLRAGEIDEAEVKRLKEGRHENFMSNGSIAINPRRLWLLNGYRVMFRFMSFIPPWAKKFMLRSKLYKIFWLLPFPFLISTMDLIIMFRDRDAWSYMRSYLWWIGKRFDPGYHLFFLRRLRRRPPGTCEAYELRADGLVGIKTERGWEFTPSGDKMAYGDLNDAKATA